MKREGDVMVAAASGAEREEGGADRILISQVPVGNGRGWFVIHIGAGICLSLLPEIGWDSPNVQGPRSQRKQAAIVPVEKSANAVERASGCGGHSEHEES